MIGVALLRNKVDTVLKMGAPTNNLEVHSFIGTVTFYKFMWLQWPHILVPLLKLTVVLVDLNGEKTNTKVLLK